MLRRGCCLAITLRQSLLSLSLLVCVSSHVRAQTLPQLPLLEKAKVLQCVESESAAKVALGAFWEIQDTVGNFPDEHLLESETKTLHAATLDILLNSLVTTAERFPALRSQVERTMLQWNYCDVMQEGVLFDIESGESRVSRAIAPKTSPIDWQGFKKLGFFGEVEGRFIPELISSDQQSLRVDFEWLFHRIYRQQCFPHPDTSDLFDRFENKINQKLVSLPAVSDDADYPYAWDPECIHPVLVPTLEANVVIEAPLFDVPLLNTQLSLVETMRNVPKLKTALVISQTEIKIPLLKTKVEVKAATVTIPKLLTRVVLDTPKSVVKPKIVNKSVAYSGIPSHSHSGNGSAHSHAAPAPVQAVKAVRSVKLVEPKKAIVIDKNQPLLERLLAGLSSGSNVLIVDKIQLTVNEYNGSVETVISSSDVEAANATLPTIAPASDVKQFVERQFVPKKSTQSVTAKLTKPVVKPVVKESTDQRLVVPMVESLVFVEPVAVKELPKVVVIKKKGPNLLRVPSLKTQISVAKNQVKKPRTQRKPKKAVRQKSRDDTSSSLFIYRPYENGDKPKAGEKTVEELLQAYAEYEAARAARAAKSAKKKLKSDEVESYAPISNKTVDSQSKVAVEKKPKQDHKSTMRPDDSEVEVSKLQTQVVIAKSGLGGLNKETVDKKKQQTPPKETVLAASSDLKHPKTQYRYTFADKQPDAVDFAQYSAAATNVPVGLGIDAPVPYIIDETFVEAPTNSTIKKVKKKPIGLAGNVYLKQSLNEGKWAIGGSINRKIIKDDYWFARGGWNYALENEEDPFSYSWGIGYSDWHPGTFSAQLNNWGPIKPGEGLAFDKAIASFGYSVKSETLKKYRLSASGALNIPIDGNSTASANFRWSPKENWYINTSLSYPIEGDGEPKWTYGFGYSDWRPDKFNLQYSNYGPNDLFEDNYKKNGTWSFSYNWKF